MNGETIMPNGRNNTAIAIVLVILMIGATAGAFVMFQALESKTPHPYQHSHDYTFEGTMSGVPCTGQGHSSYVSESDLEYLYIVNYSLSGTKEIDARFDMAFDTSEKMLPDSIYKDGGIGTFDGKDVHIWTAALDGKDYTFYVGDHCTLIGVHIVCDEYDVTGTIADP